MTNKHTPGNWDINAYNLSQVIKISDGKDKDGNSYIDGKHQEKIATCYGDNDIANARLIAAAPELLEALEQIVWKLSHGSESEPNAINRKDATIKMAVAAIKKAKGE